MRIAVTGNIGAGKSAVTGHLAARGAAVIDADEVAREVVAPGAPAYQPLVDAFGTAVLTPEGTIDRAFLADVVFHDPSALARLNAITHAAIGRVIVERLVASDHAPLAVVALPLFRPLHRQAFGLQEVWCVWVDPEVALERLVGARGMTEVDARARMANQPPLAQRKEEADELIHNAGSVEDLFTQVDALLARKGLLVA